MPTATGACDGAIRLPYGPDRQQFGDLRLPPAPRGGGAPLPLAILIHGGFWRAPYGLDLMDGLGDDLAARGIASWNIEYRRVGDPGGGWPGTLRDVAAAADRVRDLAPAHGLDLGRVVAIGHSAGGHLALWLAARPRLSPDALANLGGAADGGGAPAAPLPLTGAISLAGVADLDWGWRRGLGRGAVAELLGGGPGEVPERYAAASPAALLPLGVPQVLVHGGADDRVPLALSQDYAAAARAGGDRVRLRDLPGVDHFAPIDPASDAWAVAVDELLALLGVPGSSAS